MNRSAPRLTKRSNDQDEPIRRRPVLIQANIGRGLLIALIPLAAAGGFLRIEYLYVIAFLVGTLTVFFDLAYRICPRVPFAASASAERSSDRWSSPAERPS